MNHCPPFNYQSFSLSVQKDLLNSGWSPGKMEVEVKMGAKAEVKMEAEGAMEAKEVVDMKMVGSYDIVHVHNNSRDVPMTWSTSTRQDYSKVVLI